MIDSLPLEVLELILEAVPLREDSIRPASGLLPLLTVSRTLHSIINSRLHREVHLRSVAQLGRFIPVYPLIGSMVKVLHAYPPPGGAVWPASALARLLRTLALTQTSVADLRLKAGVDSAGILLAPESPFLSCTLEKLSAFSLELTEGADPPFPSDSRSASTLMDGRMDHRERSSLELEQELDYGEGEMEWTTSQKDRHETSGSDLSSLPNLTRFRLCGIPAHLNFFQPLGYWPTRLHHLELERSHLPDDNLLAFLAASPHLRSLIIKGCSGFSRDSLVAGICSVGTQLERLELAGLDQPQLAAPTASSSRSSFPPPSSPPQSPLLRPSIYELLSNVMDDIVPHTPALLHLSIRGSLASPSFPLLLSTSTPSLRSLSIQSCPSLSAITLQPLLGRRSLRLFELSVLSVDQVLDTLEETRAAQELFLMASDGLALRGTMFDKIISQMGWAWESARAIDEAMSTTAEVSSPSRRRRKPGRVS